MRRLSRHDMQVVEMQMGPMIDMVFLLLVFFMVTAKPVKQEADVGLTLPGTVSQEESVDLPDEQRILIQPGGQVVLNDLPIDGPGTGPLPGLLKTLIRFRESTEAAKAEALVTIDADDTVLHQRIVDVLNTCAQAKIKGVTFSDSTTEEE